MFGLTIEQIIVLAAAAIIISFAKTGITGASLPALTMVASVFGGKLSSGIMLSALIIADIPAIYYYRKHRKLEDIIKLIWPAVLGIILGAIVGDYLNDKQFKLLMGVIVIVCITLLLYGEISRKSLPMPEGKWFPTLVGVIAGFASMVGNAAGPVMIVYLLSLSFERKRFIGTVAWFFFFVNLIKLPFHVFMWKTISLTTLRYTIIMIPFIFIGAWLGVHFVKRINEKVFRWLVIIATFIAAIRLMK